MSKNKIAAKEEIVVNDLDFSDFMHSYDEDDMMSALSGLIDASNQQMTIALELTKLIAGNDKSEEQVFSIYKKAAKLVCENYSLKTMLQEVDTYQ